jgi:hypothetical protein
MKINPKSYFLFLLLIYSPVLAQHTQTFTRFELGGGATYLMPRGNYDNGWGFNLDGVLNISRRYGINLTYSTTNVKLLKSENTRSVTSFVGNLEISFRRGDYAHGFTSIGLATVSIEEKALFIFGAGIKVPFHERFLFRIELIDYHTDIGIPFLSFPGGRIALQGIGTKYLELGIGIAYTFGERKRIQHRLLSIF